MAEQQCEENSNIKKKCSFQPAIFNIKLFTTFIHEIIKPLSESGLTVHCWERKTRNEMVQKQIRCQNTTQQSKTTKILNSLKDLTCPHIIRYLKYEQNGLNFSVFSEYCNGGHVLDLIDEMTQSQQSFTRSIATALDIIHHKQGIIIKNLKPQKIVMALNKKIFKITGLEPKFENADDSNKTSSSKQIQYQSPEKFQHLPETEKTDIFSLGLIVYNLVELRNAFGSSQQENYEQRVISGVPDPFIRIQEGSLSRLILKMLEKDPNNRPSAEQIIHIPEIINSYWRVRDFLQTMQKAELNTKQYQTSQLKFRPQPKQPMSNQPSTFMSTTKNSTTFQSSIQPLQNLNQKQQPQDSDIDLSQTRIPETIHPISIKKDDNDIIPVITDLDRYVKKENGSIGQGGFGKAVIVFDRHTGQEYVRKRITKFDEQSRKRALAEAESMWKLKSPYVVEIIGYHEKPKKFYLIMERCQNGDLSKVIDYMKKTGSVPTKEKMFELVGQIGSALNHLHQSRVIHRDLKPANIFLCSSFQAKLGDFGVSREMQIEESSAHTIAGTSFYMSPEMIQNLGFTTSTDMWSLGCVLYEYGEQRLPFEAPKVLELNIKIINEQPRPFEKITYEPLKQLISRLLNKDPSRRPSAEDLLDIPEVSDRLNYLLEQSKEREIQEQQMEEKIRRDNLMRLPEILKQMQENKIKKENKIKQMEIMKGKMKTTTLKASNDPTRSELATSQPMPKFQPNPGIRMPPFLPSRPKGPPLMKPPNNKPNFILSSPQQSTQPSPEEQSNQNQSQPTFTSLQHPSSSSSHSPPAQDQVSSLTTSNQSKIPFTQPVIDNADVTSEFIKYQQMLISQMLKSKMNPPVTNNQPLNQQPEPVTNSVDKNPFRASKQLNNPVTQIPAVNQSLIVEKIIEQKTIVQKIEIPNQNNQIIIKSKIQPIPPPPQPQLFERNAELVMKEIQSISLDEQSFNETWTKADFQQKEKLSKFDERETRIVIEKHSQKTMMWKVYNYETPDEQQSTNETITSIRKTYEYVKRNGIISSSSSERFTSNTQQQPLQTNSMIDLQQHKSQFMNTSIIIDKPGFLMLIQPLGFFVNNEEGRGYLVMEYNGEENLRKFGERLSEDKALKEQDAWQIIYSISLLLEQFHTLGIAVGSLRPESLYMNEKMQIKIGDYGINNQIEEEINLLAAPIRQLLFLAPESYNLNLNNGKNEQKSQSSFLTKEADVYTLGVILYTLLVGKYPFALTSKSSPAPAQIFAQLREICESESVAVTIPSHYSRRLSGIISSMLKKDPSQRITVAKILEYDEVQNLIK